MKSMRNIVVAFAAVLAANTALAVDSYLYWMASDTVTNPLGGDTVDYTYARVNYGGSVDEAGNVTGGTWLSPYVNGEKQGTAMTKAGVTAGPSYWGEIANYTSGTSFIFELFNESFEAVGWHTFSGDATQYLGQSESQPKATYTLSQVVPEPTSGLLSLFGLAALALRRRKRA